MTKYILNSGGLRNQPEKARKFFAEIVKGLGPAPKILICYFMQPRELWEKKFAENIEKASELYPTGVTPELQLAQPDAFVEQLTWCDVLYLHGGDDHLLKYWLSRYDVPAIWEGKVVVGASAGADILSRYFWTCDWRMCMDGLGIVPVKFLPHFGSDYGKDDTRGPVDWQKGLEELKAYKEELPVHALKEGEYIVIEQ